ncbi:hypothetical protein QN386_22300 [Pseudomonas sp. CCI3.2]|uniref:hypothetical protein n=1 Tax=unclassified Pseudomonas TaxID=196821 RepID=UPI002B22B1E5|nr:MULTISPECIES: hypothetical protein [unclassified Pseudomonas]MEB0078029.1 hypothetical protein [Pseudomonas sp. MH10out]MEB0104036.1 hypothetical protein [Pseudomonas sp. CCI3.2]MEB0133547.1 hypothetical protein [Pseudomonas sp. CCI2.4]
MSGYLIKNTVGVVDRFHVYRPGETSPAFMLPTITEALDIVELDRAQPAPLNRCVGCVELTCPCMPEASV